MHIFRILDDTTEYPVDLTNQNIVPKFMIVAFLDWTTSIPANLNILYTFFKIYLSKCFKVHSWIIATSLKKLTWGSNKAKSVSVLEKHQIPSSAKTLYDPSMRIPE